MVCEGGHAFCIEALWNAPLTSADIMANRSSHPVIQCWGVAFDDEAHPESIRALGLSPDVIADCWERLAVELIGLGVDLSTVIWTGRGL